MVSAAGGGIQASAWTARVLTGLDELYGEPFTRSVGVISGVSGGSVGAMFYLAGGDWSGPGPAFNADSRAEVNTNAESSSLEATAWGLAYPDLIRTFAPFLVGKHVDRGWAIERSWESLIGWDIHLLDWIEPIREHHMPVPIFNATLAETGQRLLISPVLKQRTSEWDASDACEFFNLYPDNEANPLLTTAVRLSATFPYISPMSRAEGAGIAEEKCYHVADGGYAENGGIFTLLDWANELVRTYEDSADRPFDRIVIVRILPFPRNDRPSAAKLDQGWTYEVLGPIDTIGNVRTASQAERNDFDLDLLAIRVQAGGSDDVGGKIPIYSTSFEFEPPDGSLAPLSWHLTTRQKATVRQAWDDVKEGHVNHTATDDEASTTALEILDQFFHRQ
jgi:hypothetical protein